MKHKTLALVIGAAIGSTSLATAHNYVTNSPVTTGEWYAAGAEAVRQNRSAALSNGLSAYAKAKNVILFVGDGMGVTTTTAARIFEGQQLGLDGEEHELFFERFPNVALSKVFNTNQQTPDSAGTMTAMMTGVKTKAGVIGLGPEVARQDCTNQAGNELMTALEYAEIIGMATGVVSSARITHATPAATYAHVPDRNFEDDHDGGNVIGEELGLCKDIASQLIELPDRMAGMGYRIDGIEVAMGGGRRSFLPRVDGVDPETGGRGERDDMRDLTAEWIDRYPQSAFVWDQAGFDAIHPGSTKHLLGLFDASHVEYETDRLTDEGGEPALSEMTAKAIEILDNDRDGFFLHVESGRIDHAHHATNPYRALEDTVEFAKAIKTAYEMTDPRETLIIVTADHSHVFTIAGYPTRGNPILGKVVTNDNSGSPAAGPALASDSLPYTTIGYTNGVGFYDLPGANTADAIYENPAYSGRADLTGVDTGQEGFHSEVLVPLGSETHSAEDVAIYAIGPGSGLINGVMEQNEIYHVMNTAGRLEERAERKSRPRRGWWSW
jgi:alkaline phosphatase